VSSSAPVSSERRDGDGADMSGPILTRFIPMQMKRRRVQMRLVIEGHDARTAAPDPALLNAVACAHRWCDDLVCGRAASLGEIAARAGVSTRYVRHLLRLAFLAPAIVEAVVEGRQLAELTAEPLIKRVVLPPTGPPRSACSASGERLRQLRSSAAIALGGRSSRSAFVAREVRRTMRANGIRASSFLALHGSGPPSKRYPRDPGPDRSRVLSAHTLPRL